MKQISKEVYALLRGIVNKREKTMKAGKIANSDLLGILMESNFREIQEHQNNKKIGMSVKDVIEECKLFYLSCWPKDNLSFACMDNGPAKRASKLASLCKRRGFTVFGNKKPEADGLNHLKIVSTQSNL